MADTANRSEIDVDGDDEDIAETDPLAQLAFLMGDSPAAAGAPSDPAAAGEVASDELTADAPQAPEPDSLEDALLAELDAAVQDETTPQAEEPQPETTVADTPEIETPEFEASEVAEDDGFAPVDIDVADTLAEIDPEPAALAEIEAEPAAEATPSPEAKAHVSLEDELQALLGAGPIEVADPADLAVDLPKFDASPSADADIASEPAATDTAMADDAADEPVIALSPSDGDMPAMDEPSMRTPFFAPVDEAPADQVDDGHSAEPDVEETVSAEDFVLDDLARAMESDDNAVIAAGETNIDEHDVPETEATSTDAGWAETAPSEHSLASDVEHADAEPGIETSPPADAEADPGALSDFDAALEEDFSQLFDEEIAAEQAAETHKPFVSRANPVPAAGSAAEMSPLDELEALMAEDGPLLGDHAPATQTDDGAPVLETVDMAGFEGRDASTYDLPELDPELSRPEQSAAGHDDDSAHDAVRVEAAAAAVAGTVTMATAASSAASSRQIDLDDAFNESEFEAELARDMEFVSHDQQTMANTDSDQDDDMDAAAAAAPRSARKGLVTAGVIGLVAIAGAVGIYAYGSGDAATTDEGPIVVAADPEPVKVAPEDPGGTQVPNQDRAVFGAETGIVAEAPEQETLVTTSEEPVDIAAAVPADTDTTAQAGEKIDNRLEPAAQTATEQANEASGLTTPRRVRTLVVKPDGTLVEKPAPEPETETVVAAAPATTETEAATDTAGAIAEIAAAEPTPADAAQTAAAASDAPAGAATAEADAEAQSEVAASTEGEGTAAQDPLADVPERVANAEATAEAVVQQVPVRRVTTQTITPPVIRDRPADQPVTIINPQAQRQTTQQVAAVEPQAAPAQPAATQAAASPFTVQISSQTSREAAQQSAADLLSRFRNVLGGRGVSIQEANIPGKGLYFRVRVAASSRDDAVRLCEDYKRAGGSCFVSQ